MSTLLFGLHQTSELTTLLQRVDLRHLILTAYVRPVRADHSQYRCQWRVAQRPTPRQPNPHLTYSNHILICGYCWNGVIRLWDKPDARARVPECHKCGARVCGIEWDSATWLGLKRAKIPEDQLQPQQAQDAQDATSQPAQPSIDLRGQRDGGEG